MEIVRAIVEELLKHAGEETDRETVTGRAFIPEVSHG